MGFFDYVARLFIQFSMAPLRRKHHRNSHEFRNLVALIEKRHKEVINHITKKTSKIMATIAQLNQKVDDLQLALDTKQEAIATAIAALEQAVKDAQAANQGAATAEELQALSDKMDGILADLTSTPTA